MIGNLVKAEFRKILTTKNWWALLIPATGAALVFALIWGAVTNDVNNVLDSDEMQELAALTGTEINALPVGLMALSHGVNIGTMFPVIFGILGLAGEYNKKTITTTFLTAPNRVSALSAKMLTYVFWGAVYGVAIVGISSLATVIVVDEAGLPTAGQWLGVLGAGVLACILATLFGIGVGAVWNSVVGATVTLCIWMLLIENALLLLTAGVENLRFLGGVLPNGTLNGIVGAISAEAFGAAGLSVPGDINDDLQWFLQWISGAPGTFGWWISALIFAAWAMVFFIAGWIVNQKRDIT